MNAYLIIKTLHIISSTILFGTGLGIAFFMFSSRYTKGLPEKYHAARFTILADFIFTVPAVILQPLTGIWLVANSGYDPHVLWLNLTYALYVLAGICWLPVVWIQIQLKRILAECIKKGSGLPKQYYKLFRIWFWLGWPAFLALIAIFYLMVAKPA